MLHLYVGDTTHDLSLSCSGIYVNRNVYYIDLSETRFVYFVMYTLITSFMGLGVRGPYIKRLEELSTYRYTTEYTSTDIPRGHCLVRRIFK
jgi:hypothetical protein